MGRKDQGIPLNTSNSYLIDLTGGQNETDDWVDGCFSLVYSAGMIQKNYNRKIRLMTVLACCLGLLAPGACKKNSDTGEVVISHYGSNESHKTGDNCMNCHTSGGSGEGAFTVAGTVYDAAGANVLPNSTVKLYESADTGGTPLMTIEVDGKGNFYTTEPVNWGGGLVVTASAGPNGPPVTTMVSTVTSGACNRCHDGVNLTRIRVF